MRAGVVNPVAASDVDGVLAGMRRGSGMVSGRVCGRVSGASGNRIAQQRARRHPVAKPLD